MIRLTGTITYSDGREQPIEVTQAEYAAFELWAIRHGIDATPAGSPPMVMTRFLGYAAAHRAAQIPRKEWVDFEEWSAVDVELEAPDSENGQVPAAAAPFPADLSAE